MSLRLILAAAVSFHSCLALASDYPCALGTDASRNDNQKVEKDRLDCWQREYDKLTQKNKDLSQNYDALFRRADCKDVDLTGKWQVWKTMDDGQVDWVERNSTIFLLTQTGCRVIGDSDPTTHTLRVFLIGNSGQGYALRNDKVSFALDITIDSPKEFTEENWQNGKHQKVKFKKIQ